MRLVHAIQHGLLRLLFLVPVLTFVGVSGWFNYLFSIQLGNPAWIVVGLAAAGYAALGLDLMRVCWRRRARMKAFAAFLLWLPATTYDGIAAYGFATREQASAAQQRTLEQQPQLKAQRDVAEAESALQPYADAPNAEAANDAVAALERIVPDARCRQARMLDLDRDACARLTEARLAAARATAKARLRIELAEARQALAAAPLPPLLDKRAELFGPEVLAWLPVVLLQAGTILGVFAATVPFETPEYPTTKEKWRWRLKRRAPTPSTEPQPRSLLRPGPAAGGPLLPRKSIVALLTSLGPDSAPRPPGITVDASGWIRGGQRRLAAAAGMPLTRFNREAKAAQRQGLVEMDTSGNETAIRLRQRA